MEYNIKEKFVDFIGGALKDNVYFEDYKEAVNLFAEIECKKIPQKIKKDFLYEHFDFVMEVSKYDKFNGYFNEKYFMEYDDKKRDRLLDNAIYEYFISTLLLDKQLYKATQLFFNLKYVNLF